MDDYDEYIENTVHILDLAEVDFMEISKADRRRTLELELEMTEAADNQDTAKFLMLLDQWRSIFMRGTEGEQCLQREAA